MGIFGRILPVSHLPLAMIIYARQHHARIHA